jgi:hypothetical protein
MKRWAKACTKLSIIPPHPTQFSQLLSIRTANQRRVSLYVHLILELKLSIIIILIQMVEREKESQLRSIKQVNTTSKEQAFDNSPRVVILDEYYVWFRF